MISVCTILRKSSLKNRQLKPLATIIFIVDLILLKRQRRTLFLMDYFDYLCKIPLLGLRYSHLSLLYWIDFVFCYTRVYHLKIFLMFWQHVQYFKTASLWFLVSFLVCFLTKDACDKVGTFNVHTTYQSSSQWDCRNILLESHTTKSIKQFVNSVL